MYLCKLKARNNSVRLSNKRCEACCLSMPSSRLPLSVIHWDDRYYRLIVFIIKSQQIHSYTASIKKIRERWPFHCSKYEDYCLLIRDAVQSGNSLQTFRRNSLPPFSWLNSKLCKPKIKRQAARCSLHTDSLDLFLYPENEGKSLL